MEIPSPQNKMDCQTIKVFLPEFPNQLQPDPSKDVGDLLKTALHKLKDSNGSALKDVKKYLVNGNQLYIASKNDEIKLFVSDTIKNEYLEKAEGKFKATKRHRLKSPSKGGKRKYRRKRTSRKKKGAAPSGKKGKGTGKISKR